MDIPKNQFFTGVEAMFFSFFKYCEKQKVNVDLNALFTSFIKEELNMSINPIVFDVNTDSNTVDEVDEQQVAAAKPVKKPTKKKVVKKTATAVNDGDSSSSEDVKTKKDTEGKPASEESTASGGEFKKPQPKKSCKPMGIDRENQTRVSLSNLNNEAWSKQTKVNYLKVLCKERGLSISGPKNALIQSLVKYEEQFNDAELEETEAQNDVDAAIVRNRLKRTKKPSLLARQLSNAESKEIEVIKKYGLNLVDVDEDYMLVLSIESENLSDAVVIGTVNKEDMTDDAVLVDVHSLTEESIKKAQVFKLPFSIPDNF